MFIFSIRFHIVSAARTNFTNDVLNKRYHVVPNQYVELEDEHLYDLCVDDDVPNGRDDDRNDDQDGDDVDNEQLRN